jgi:hypothetical protein
MRRFHVQIRKPLRIVLFAVVVAFSVVPLWCAGAYVGVSVPVGYYPYGGRSPYGGWGPSVGVTVPLGRPARY